MSIAAQIASAQFDKAPAKVAKPRRTAKKACRPGYSCALRFLRGEGTDHRGRSLAFVLAQDADWWAGTRDFIQWVFPTTAPSRFGPHAPVLTREELAQLGTDEQARSGLVAAYRKALGMLGLGLTADGEVQELSLPAGAACSAWMRHASHLDKRITRMLDCLRGAGLQREAQALLAFLKTRFAGSPAKKKALPFWGAAVAPQP